ncbi:MAG: hypothetical protein A3J83_01800 [Elusimicrobia bacterium RIFOXYA2_FULL_40_6]|nr:MAG: hypothetical protein A3J83_01800 [Elusimicrobia bacterium RIFOXYA2_FULL_40_6]
MKINLQRSLFIVSIMFLSSAQFCVSDFGDVHTHPPKPRIGANILTGTNSTFDSGLGNWTISGTPVLDSTVRHGASGQSIRLSGSGTAGTNCITNTSIPLQPGGGKVYTVSTYMMRTSTAPCFVNIHLRVTGGTARNEMDSFQGTDAQNQWQEISRNFVTRPGDTALRIMIYRTPDAPTPAGNIYIDDVYVGEGVGYDQLSGDSGRKTPFSGSVVRVDDLGNFEVKKSTYWAPFFPVGMYFNHTLTDFSDYSDQGFNVAMWCNDYNQIRYAKDAVSGFNPDGMMGSLQIAKYVSPILDGGGAYNDLPQLTSTINGIKNANLMGSLLFYYWDHEKNYGAWNVIHTMFNAIKAQDVDAQSNRMHPIYGLHGFEGLTKVYDHLTDVCGDYVTDMENRTAFGTAYESSYGLMVQDNIEKQSNPVCIGQINEGTTAANYLTAGQMRRRVYDSIIGGAKGIGYFKDGGSQGNVRTKAWWPTFPQLRREIDAMLPIIRQPQWTSWSVTSSSNPILFTTRDYNGQGYIIAVNEINSPVTTTIRLNTMSYTVGPVKDFITGAIAATAVGQQFTVTFPAFGSAVYQLIDNGQPQTIYTYTANVSPVNSGSISPVSGQFLAGSVLTLTATPNMGSTFTSWSGDASGTNPTTTLTMNSNKTVTANFSVSSSFNLTTTVSPSGSGSVSANPSGGIYTAGTVVNLTATPNTGYVFSSWSNGASGTNPNVSVTMDANKTITANFVSIQTYTLTTTISPSGAGTVTPPNGLYNRDSQMTLRATANEGYTFSNWSGSVSGENSNLPITMSGNIAVTANFGYIPAASIFLEGPITLPANGVSIATITANMMDSNGEPIPSWTYPITFTISSGGGSLLGVNPVNSVNGVATMQYLAGSTVENVVIEAASPGLIGGATNIHLISAGTVLYNVNAMAVPSDAGTVTPSNGNYALGENVTLTATPKSGYIFYSWGGSIGGAAIADNQLTITSINADKTITANFISAITPVSISIDASPTSLKANGSSTSIITAYLKDYNNELAQSSTNTVTFSLTGGTGSFVGANSVAAVGGIAAIQFRAGSSIGIATITATSPSLSTGTVNIDLLSVSTVLYNFKVTLEPPEGGSIIASDGGKILSTDDNCVKDHIINLIALPADGYDFNYWGIGGAYDNNNPTTVTMDSDKNIIAYFNPIAVIGNESPEVTINVSTTVHNLPQTITITARAVDYDGDISSVVFYCNGSQLGMAESNSDTYQYKWKVTIPGTYIITAQVFDNAGASSAADVSVLAKGKDVKPITAVVKVVGGAKGYINPDNGDTVDVVINPPSSGEVVASFYNMRGELVKEMTKVVTNGVQEDFEWDCKNKNLNIVAAGIYFVHVKGAGIDTKKKIAIIR